MGDVGRSALTPSLMACIIACISLTCWLISADERNQQAGQSEAYLELNSHNYQQVAARIASSQREILLTTVDITYRGYTDPDRVLDLFRNFAWHLAKVGRLQHTLVVSYTPETCWYLIGIGIPCFTDRAAMQPQDLPGIHGRRPPTFQKYWHALELVRLNYTLLVLDPDVSALQDPFRFHNSAYDIEGLSDWEHFSEVPSPKQYASWGCPIYKLVQRTEDSNAMLEGHWRVESGNHLAAMKHVSPCQSTGLWFAEPRPATVMFLAELLEWMLEYRPTQWEQAAFNELIMSHVIGVEERSPLRYRIVPVRHFLNLPVYQLRQQQHMGMDLAVLHAGGVHGWDKVTQLKTAGVWGAEQWQTGMGQPLIDRLTI